MGYVVIRMDVLPREQVLAVRPSRAAANERSLRPSIILPDLEQMAYASGAHDRGRCRGEAGSDDQCKVWTSSARIRVVAEEPAVKGGRKGG